MVPRPSPGVCGDPHPGQRAGQPGAQPVSQATGSEALTALLITSLPPARISSNRLSRRLQVPPAAPFAVGENSTSYDIRAYEPSGASAVIRELKKYAVPRLWRSLAGVRVLASCGEYRACTWS